MGKYCNFNNARSIGQRTKLKTWRMEKCPYFNSCIKTDESKVGEVMKWGEANNPGAMYALGNYYENGHIGVQQDHLKAVELWNRASELGYSLLYRGRFEEGLVPL